MFFFFFPAKIFYIQDGLDLMPEKVSRRIIISRNTLLRVHVRSVGIGGAAIGSDENRSLPH